MGSSLAALLAAVAFLAPARGTPELVAEQWVVKSVAADGRSLVLYSVHGGCDATPRASVTESADAVEIRVQHPAPQSEGPCPAIAVYEKLRVRLQDPIGGRDLVGQSLNVAPLGTPGRERMPRMLGLQADDARFAFEAYGIRVRGDRKGTVRRQDPRPGARVPSRRVVTLEAGDDAAPTPPLEPVTFRTIAKDDGASSELQKPAGLAIRGQRHWKRVWRSLTAGTEPRPRRPRIDFSRHMLLVAVQGRQPSGGHETRITDVGDTGASLIADVDDVAPGRSCITTKVETSPYHVVRVRRTGDPVHFTRHPLQHGCGR